MESRGTPARGGIHSVAHPRRPRDFLRPNIFLEAEAQWKSRGPREISRAEGNLKVGGDVQWVPHPLQPQYFPRLSWSSEMYCISQHISPLGIVRIHSGSQSSVITPLSVLCKLSWMKRENEILYHSKTIIKCISILI